MTPSTGSPTRTRPAPTCSRSRRRPTPTTCTIWSSSRSISASSRGPLYPAGGRETAPTRRLTTAPLPTATAMIPLNPMTHRNPSHRNPVREPTRTRGSRTVSTCLPVTSGSRSPTTATVASSTRRPAPRRSACGAATTRCLTPRRRSSTGSRRISAATRTYRSSRWPANRCTSAMSRTEPSRISAKSSPEGRSRPSKSRIRPANARAETNSRRRFR